MKYAFYSSMTYGYEVDHENIHEDEDRSQNEFWNNFKKNYPKLLRLKIHLLL